MRVLLLSMPDSFEHTPALTMRMPNGALASLAGNLGPAHQVAVADLIPGQVFRRYNALRAAEREYVPEPAAPATAGTARWGSAQR